MIDLSSTHAHLRPRTRAECPPPTGPNKRPCPWVSCRYHLAVYVTMRGRIKLQRADCAPEDWDLPCALDHARRGGMTLEEVGEVLGLSRERVRQIEEVALHKMREEWED